MCSCHTHSTLRSFCIALTRTSHRNNGHNYKSVAIKIFKRENYFVTTGFTNSLRQIKQAKGNSSSSLDVTTNSLSSSKSLSTNKIRNKRERNEILNRPTFSSLTAFAFLLLFLLPLLFLYYYEEGMLFAYNLPTALVITSIVNELARISKRAVASFFVILTNF